MQGVLRDWSPEFQVSELFREPLGEASELLGAMSQHTAAVSYVRKNCPVYDTSEQGAAC